ncbi:DUF6538 domain-containing protein [Ponticoccus alexandrii]|uniref:DUF6538 domain-containing protein n=1 Tax=Ponticoccus alexandrii TaxID=1943633 RepID=UPI003D80C9AA
MAGKLRHFLQRDGRFYSRIVVPKELRGIIGKSELRAPLGADRREAVRRHQIEVAKLMTQVAAAEEKLALTTGARPAQPRYPMSGEEMAQLNYRLRLDQDAEVRVASPAYARVGIDDQYVGQLRAGIAGAATDTELCDLVGHRIALFRARGYTEAVQGTPEWRGLAMMLCVSEYEALERAVERDEGFGWRDLAPGPDGACGRACGACEHAGSVPGLPCSPEKPEPGRRYNPQVAGHLQRLLRSLPP